MDIRQATRINESMINLINGNLADARRLAKGISKQAIVIYAYQDLMRGWSLDKARAAAEYLKASDATKGALFQRYCDAQ